MCRAHTAAAFLLAVLFTLSFFPVLAQEGAPVPESGGNTICKGWKPKDGPKQCPVTGDDGKVDVNGECVGDGRCEAISYWNAEGQLCNVTTKICTGAKPETQNAEITIPPAHAIPESSLPPFTQESVREAVQSAPENMGQSSLTPAAPDFKDIVMQPGEAPAGVVPGTEADWADVPWLKDLSTERVELQSETAPDAKPVQTVEVTGGTQGDNTFKDPSRTERELLQEASTFRTPEEDCGWLCTSVNKVKDTASNIGTKISDGFNYVTNNIITSETEAGQGTKTVVASTYGWDQGKGDSSTQPLAISTKDNPARLDQYPWTFAEKTGPLGEDQKYLFTNPKTGEGVVLARLDRGPYEEGRDVDISRKAAEALNMGRTVVPLQMTPVPADAPLGPVGNNARDTTRVANVLAGAYESGEVSGLTVPPYSGAIPTFNGMSSSDGYPQGLSGGFASTIEQPGSVTSDLATNIGGNPVLAIEYGAALPPAVETGSNIPVPEEAPVNLPTQAEMQAELLRTQGQSTLIDYTGFQDIAGQAPPAEQVREMEAQQLEARRLQADAEARAVSESAPAVPATPRLAWETGADIPGFRSPLTDISGGYTPGSGTAPPSEFLSAATQDAQSGFTPGTVTAPPEIPGTFTPPEVAKNELPVSQEQPIRDEQVQNVPLQTTPASQPCPGPSVVDCLASRNMPTDFTSRQRLASEYGIARYNGTPEQNARLLNELRTNTAPATVHVPVAPVVPPAPALNAYASAAGYTGGSITDFLNRAGQPSDFASREILARSFGISNYVGSVKQNTQLLTALRSQARAR